MGKNFRRLFGQDKREQWARGVRVESMRCIGVFAAGVRRSSCAVGRTVQDMPGFQMPNASAGEPCGAACAGADC